MYVTEEMGVITSMITDVKPFNAFSYMGTRYDLDVRKLPTVYVQACRNENDIKELIDQLHRIL